MSEDFKTVLELIKGGVKSENLERCFNFLVAGGNEPVHVPFVI